MLSGSAQMIQHEVASHLTRIRDCYLSMKQCQSVRAGMPVFYLAKSSDQTTLKIAKKNLLSFTFLNGHRKNFDRMSKIV